MVLESTIICVDNSEYMRNGDFIPNRLQAQQDAVNLVCHAKIRSNPENNVALLTLAGHPQVLTTLTTDTGRLLGKLHQVQTLGDINFLTGIRIAHLALKHRQGKNHKMRIVAFIGSPVETDEKELVKIAKKLKKEKVNVDLINFGEEVTNTDKLSAFIKVLDGSSSHMVTVPSGSLLSDALYSSPVILGEDGNGAAGLGGGGFEFGIDPNEDPELALALRVSMEEQRQRQEEEARQSSTEPTASGSGETSGAAPAAATSSAVPCTDAPGASTSAAESAGQAANTEEEMLEKALAMSLQQSDFPDDVDISGLTEEEQIEYAMQMSLQAAQDEPKEEPMDTDDNEGDKPKN